MRTAIMILFLMLAATSALAADTLWVTAERLHRRTCPDTQCGSVGWLFYREQAIVYEKKGGWGRVSKYYDASCNNGVSEYVDTGNAKCATANGISGGKFAEWVSLDYLAATRPPDPGVGAAGFEKLVSGSDDYRQYKSAFVAAAKKLIANGRCTSDDFEQAGGWTKSTTTYRNKPVYFVYCGAFTLSNRLYLNASTGEIFQ